MKPLRFTRLLLIAGAVAGVGVTATSAASAAATTQPPSVQDQISSQLRDYPGGVQTGPREVSYEGGKVTLSFPAAGTRAAADPCTPGAYCFYDGPDFTGRKLTFFDCGGWQYLTDYGFGNKTSSWQNTSINHVQVYDLEPSPIVLLWTKAPNSASSNVGTAAYNKADGFRTLCGS